VKYNEVHSSLQICRTDQAKSIGFDTDLNCHACIVRYNGITMHHRVALERSDQ